MEKVDYMTDHKCELCDREFDSKRGLSVHKSQKHDGEEEETKSTDQVSEPDSKESDQRSVSFSLRSVFVGIFLLGLTTGFVLGSLTMMMAGGIDIDTASAPNVDSGDQDTGSETTEQIFDETGVGTSEMSFEWEGGTVDLEGRAYAGSADADTVIVSYEDFSCPFCGRHNRETLPVLADEYINEGEVQYFYKHFRLANWGRDAAIASECVQMQDADSFWQFKHEMYQIQDDINQVNLDSEIEDIVESLDIDQSQFQTCYENEESWDRVQADVEEGEGFDYTVEGGRGFVTGTPSFVIYNRETGNHEAVVGAQPVSVFQSAIEQ